MHRAPPHGAQHLKSTPADYFWWRFASGEDRENAAKVTRKMSARELQQRDTAIAEVRPFPCLLSCLTLPACCNWLLACWASGLHSAPPLALQWRLRFMLTGLSGMHRSILQYLTDA